MISSTLNSTTVNSMYIHIFESSRVFSNQCISISSSSIDIQPASDLSVQEQLQRRAVSLEYSLPTWKYINQKAGRSGPRHRQVRFQEERERSRLRSAQFPWRGGA